MPAAPFPGLSLKEISVSIPALGIFFLFCAISGAKSRKTLEKSSDSVYNIPATVPNGNMESANYF